MTSCSTSLVIVFGLVLSSSGPVLSSRPKSSVQDSLLFYQASSVQPYAQASFLGCSSNAASVLADKVESTIAGSSPVEVVLASPAVTPVFSAEPPFLSTLVRQDGL